jgi:hypothetical protein
MAKKLTSIFWGAVLILGGVYTLARTMGVEVTQDPTAWAFIFGGITVISLIFYIAGGVKNWGFLFPVGIFGALALTSAMVARGVDNPAMAAPIFIGIGLPFIVAFIIDRSSNWWAIIPAGMMAFLTLVLFAVDKVPGEWIGSGFLAILAAIFFMIFLSRRARWALVVAYVMFILVFMPLLTISSHPELSGAVVLFAIGLPFLYVYITSPEHWWSIFPAGILLTLGIVTTVLLIPGIPTEEYNNHAANSILYAGVSVTFTFAWLRHHKRWAMVFSALAAILAVTSAFYGSLQQTWPVLIILAGAFLLYTALRTKPA